MKTTELINKLPSSWSEVTLQMFQTLTTTPITENNDLFDGVENSIAVISKLTGVSIDELESLPMSDLNKLGGKLSFMLKEIPKGKSTIKWKTLNEVTYNDYVGFIQLKEESLQNLHVFITNFSKDKLSEEEVLQMPITDVMSGFFLFKKQLRRYLKHSIRLEKMKLAKYRLMNLGQTLKQKMHL